MGANDVIQTISIGLGLDIGQITTQAQQARTAIDKAVPPRLERVLTLRAKVDPQTAAQVAGQIRAIEARVNQKSKILLTPKFMVGDSQIRDLRRDLESKVKRDPINLNVKLANGPQLLREIMSAIGTPSIPFTWHWQNGGPPGGAAPAGPSGNPPTPPPAPPAGAPPTPPTTAAPVTARPARTRPSRGQTPPVVAQAAPAAEPVTPSGPASRRPARRRTQVQEAPRTGHEGRTDWLGSQRRSNVEYTDDEKHIYQEMRGLPSRAHVARSGVRGAGLAGTNVPPEVGVLQSYMTPERTAALQERAEQIAIGTGLQASLKRRSDPDYKRAQKVNAALKSVKRVNGIADVGPLSEVLTQTYGEEPGSALASAWWSALMGDVQGAGIMAREARAGFKPFSGIKRVGRKLRKATDPIRGNTETAPADVLTFDALTRALTGEAATQSSSTASVRKATAHGAGKIGPNFYSKGGGYIAGQGIGIGDPEGEERYLKSLRAAKPYLVGHFDPAASSSEIGVVGADALEKLSQDDAAAVARPKRELVDERRNRQRSDRSNYNARLEAAKARDMSLEEFMLTDLGKGMLERRAAGGRVRAVGPWDRAANLRYITDTNRMSNAERAAFGKDPGLRQTYINAHQRRVEMDQRDRGEWVEGVGFVPLEIQKMPHWKVLYGLAKMPPEKSLRRRSALQRMADQTVSPHEAEIARRKLEGRAEGGRVNRFDLDAMRATGQSAESILNGMAGSPLAGGALEWLLKGTLDEHGAIKPGLEQRSQLLNQLIEKKRGGWGRAGGGRTTQGMYKVGEMGTEMFVPEQDGWIIPHHLMDQLPKRAGGGPVQKFHGTRGQLIPASVAARQGWVKGFGEIMRVFVVNWPPMASALSGQAPTPRRVARGQVNQPTANAQATALPGGGTGTGAATQPGGFTLRRGGVASKQEARAESRDQAEAFADRLTQARTNVSEALQLSPVRALSVAFGQILQTAAGGRKGILERRDVANKAINRATQEQTTLTGYSQGLLENEQRTREAQAGLFLGGRNQQDVLDQLAADRADFEKAIEQQAPRAEESTAEAEKASKNVVNKRQAARAQAVGAVGIALGTVAFSALMDLSQVALQQFTKFVMNAADAANGFALTTAKVADQLAPAAAAVSGSPQAGLAAQYARVGANSKDLGLTSAYATRLAGAQNLQQFIDLTRTERYLRGATHGSVVPGIGTGFNNGPLNMVPGLGWIGQTPGALEQLAGTFGSVGSPTTAFPLLNNFLGQGLEGKTFDRSTSQTDRAAAHQVAQAGSQLPIIGGLFKQWEVNLNDQEKQQSTFNKDLTVLNDRIYRTVGNAGKFMQTTDKTLLDASMAAFKAAGNEDAGKTFAQQGIAAVGANGSAATASIVNMIGQAALTLMPSRDELIAAMKPQLSGQLAGIQINGQRQRDELIPTQIALGLIEHPQLAPGTGLFGNNPAPTTFGPGTAPIPGIMSGAGDSLKTTSTLIDTLQKQTAALAAKGNAWLATLPADAQTAISALRALGTQYAALQTAAANIQTSVQTEQFARQQQLGMRAAGDALGLAGKQAETAKMIVKYDEQGLAVQDKVNVKATEYGKLQREQLDLQRTITQRQITFNLAMAQIAVPGSTPGEMAARVANAKTLAEEQQKQFDLGVKIQDIGISRDAADAVKSLQELTQNQAAVIKTQDIDAAIAAVQTAQGALDGYVNSFVNEQQGMEEALLNAWMTTETAMNAFQGKYDKIIDASLADLQTKYGAWLADPTATIPTPSTPTVNPYTGFVTDAAPGGTPTVNPYTGVTTGSHATGAWSTGNEYALLHAGEMVIPANQAAWMRGQMLGASVPASRGGGTIVIQINNPVVRDDSDIDAIARKVEQVMNRRALSVGVTN